MKNFFEKHDLFKVTGILILLCALLTWVVPYASYTGTEMVEEEISRIGLLDFMQYGLLGLYYFTVLITFLFVLGAFYQVLSKTKGYSMLVNKISNICKGKELILTLVVSFVLALVCAMTQEYLPLFIFIPFILSIFNKMKIDKITAFTSTFGSLLVGTMGAIYCDKVAYFINETFSVTYSSNLAVKIILLLSGYVLLNLFTVLHRKKNKIKFEEYDMFEPAKVSNSTKATVWPYIVCGILMFVTVVLAYLPWGAWKVEVFDKVTDYINTVTVFGSPLIKYIFGEFKAFGTWDLFTVQFIMLFAILLINWFGKYSLNETIESCLEGFKKITPVVVMLLLVYFVLEISVMFPVIPYIIDKIASMADSFNVFTASLSAIFTSLGTVEMQYVMSLSGAYFAGQAGADLNVLAVIFQAFYGFVGFIVPSSAILMMGLMYLNISYKEWVKFIWKFMLAMLCVISIILIALCI